MIIEQVYTKKEKKDLDWTRYNSNNIFKIKFNQKICKNVQINGNMYLLHDFALQSGIDI